MLEASEELLLHIPVPEISQSFHLCSVILSFLIHSPYTFLNSLTYLPTYITDCTHIPNMCYHIRTTYLHISNPPSVLVSPPHPPSSPPCNETYRSRKNSTLGPLPYLLTIYFLPSFLPSFLPYLFTHLHTVL